MYSYTSFFFTKVYIVYDQCRISANCSLSTIDIFVDVDDGDECSVVFDDVNDGDECSVVFDDDVSSMVSIFLHDFFNLKFT